MGCRGRRSLPGVALFCAQHSPMPGVVVELECIYIYRCGKSHIQIFYVDLQWPSLASSAAVRINRSSSCGRHPTAVSCRQPTMIYHMWCPCLPCLANPEGTSVAASPVSARRPAYHNIFVCDFCHTCIYIPRVPGNVKRFRGWILPASGAPRPLAVATQSVVTYGGRVLAHPAQSGRRKSEIVRSVSTIQANIHDSTLPGSCLLDRANVLRSTYSNVAPTRYGEHDTRE